MRPLLYTALLVLSACATATEEFPPAPELPPQSTTTATASVGSAAPLRVAQAWAHGTMNIRSGPGTQFPITSEIKAGTELRIGVPNAEGWAQVYDLTEFSMQSAVAKGWIYTKSTRLKARPPR